MTERDTDIEFDFFDEPETAETTEAQRVPRRGGPRRPPRTPTGLTPLLRLVGLIAFAILIIVLLVVWIQSCQSSSKHGRYAGYMTDVTKLANQSTAIGRDLNRQLTTPGIKETDLVNALQGLARREQQLVDSSASLDPPGPLRVINRHVVEALQFRASGLTGLANAFHQAVTAKNLQNAGSLLASQAARFTASDVVWDDLFKEPARAKLRSENVSDVEVPDSDFVVNPDLVTARSMRAILQRVRGASTGRTTGGLHGTMLVSVKALPSGTELSTSSEKTIEAGLNLAFEVTVKDSGDSAEVRIPVTLTIQQSTGPITKKATIDFISPGEEKKLVFRNFPSVRFGERVTVKADVAPVPDEAKVDNNSAEYSVIFSLPQ